MGNRTTARNESRQQAITFSFPTFEFLPSRVLSARGQLIGTCCHTLATPFVKLVSTFLDRNRVRPTLYNAWRAILPSVDIQRIILQPLPSHGPLSHTTKFSSLVASLFLRDYEY